MLTRPIAALCFILVTLYSCQPDSVTLPEPASTVDTAIQTQFTLQNLPPIHTNLPHNLQVQWSSYTFREIDGLQWRQYPITENNPTQLHSPLIQHTQYQLLVALQPNQNFTYYIAKLTSYKSDIPAYTYFNMGTFTGMVYLYTLTGELAAIEYYQDGEAQNTITQSNPKTPNNLPHTRKSCMQKANLAARCQDALSCAYGLTETLSTSSGCGGSAGGYVILITEHYTDWYNVRNTGAEYSHTQYQGATYEYVWVNSPGTGTLQQQAYTPVAYGNETGVTPTTQPERIIIDASFKNSKAGCVYNQLTQLSQGFQKAIQKFDGDFPVSHLRLSLDNLDDNKRAETAAPSNYIINITLNNDNSVSGVKYRPNLLTAKTIIHEVIHAEIWRKLLSLANSNGNINVSLINTMLKNGDYPGMLDYYLRNGNTINSDWQHQQMAAHYRQTIGRILQEFDTGIAVPNNQLPAQFYMDLAWEGLNHSTIVEWQNALTQQERNRINQVIATYISQNANQTCQ